MRKLLLFTLMFFLTGSNVYSQSPSVEYKFSKEMNGLSIFLSLTEGNKYSLTGLSNKPLIGHLFSAGKYILACDSIVLIDSYQNIRHVLMKTKTRDKLLFTKGYESFKNGFFLESDTIAENNFPDKFFGKREDLVHLLDSIASLSDAKPFHPLKVGNYKSGGLVYEKVTCAKWIVLERDNYKFLLDDDLLSQGTWKQKGEFIAFQDETFKTTFWAKVANNTSFMSISLPFYLENAIFKLSSTRK